MLIFGQKKNIFKTPLLLILEFLGIVITPCSLSIFSSHFTCDFPISLTYLSEQRLRQEFKKSD